MSHHSRLQQYRGAAVACFFACGLALGQAWLSEAFAATIYSYIDDKGNPVYTDNPETIPEQYRSRVKIQESSKQESKVSSAFQSVQETIKSRVKAIGSRGFSGKSDTDVRSFDQETILNYAGAAAVFLLFIMYLSKNSPMLRLLALSLLILLGIGAPVLIYTSQGGALDVMKQKATATGQAQQDRLRQVQ